MKKYLFLLLAIGLIAAWVYSLLTSPPNTDKSTAVPVATPMTTLTPSDADKVNVVDEVAHPSTLSMSVPQFYWQAGTGQVYDYRLHSQIQTNTHFLSKATDTHWQHIDSVLSGQLNVRFFTQQDNSIFIGFQLSPVNFSIAGQRVKTLETKVYQTFFLALFDLHGRPIQFYFPKRLHQADQKLLADMIRELQIITPAVMLLKQWTNAEQNGTGDYEAQYQWQNGQVLKQKVNYTHVTTSEQSTDLALTAKVLHSDFKATLERKTPWLYALSGNEKLLVSSQHNPISKAEHQWTLTLSDASINPDLDIWQAVNNPKQITLAFAKGKAPIISSWEALHHQQLREKFANVPLETLTNTLLQANLEKQAIDKMIPLLTDLEDYLRVYPQASAEIAQLLQQPDISQRSTGMLINSLEVVGHPQAQQALVEIISNPAIENPHVVRQAISAIGGVKVPEPLLIDNLWQMVEKATPQANTALLALGSVNYNLSQAGNQTLATQVQQDLIDYLHNKTEHPQKQQVALLALANTKNPYLLTVIEPYLNATQPSVRAAANTALVNYDDASSLHYLLTSMTQDDVVTVREAALKTLTRREDKQQAVEPLRQYLPQEGDANLRKKMIRFLGQHKIENPEIVNTLEQQLTKETSREMIQAVYKALYKKEDKPVAPNEIPLQ